MPAAVSGPGSASNRGEEPHLGAAVQPDRQQPELAWLQLTRASPPHPHPPHARLPSGSQVLPTSALAPCEHRLLPPPLFLPCATPHLREATGKALTTRPHHRNREERQREGTGPLITAARPGRTPRRATPASPPGYKHTRQACCAK